MMDPDRMEMHEAYGGQSVLTSEGRFLGFSDSPYLKSESRISNFMKNVGVSCEYTFPVARLPRPPKTLF